MNKSDSTIMWILFWLILLTLGDPDLLDKILDLLDAWIKHLGDRHA